jgi:hypothetical protein
VNKYQGDIVRIEKLDTSRVFTVLYWDNAAKAFYVKRFSFTESNNTPLLFISDARGSKLVDITSEEQPKVLLTFGGKCEHREAEVIDAESFIAKKGLAAKGKKVSPYDVKTAEFLAPDGLDSDLPGEPSEEEPEAVVPESPAAPSVLEVPAAPEAPLEEEPGVPESKVKPLKKKKASNKADEQPEEEPQPEKKPADDDPMEVSLDFRPGNAPSEPEVAPSGGEAADLLRRGEDDKPVDFSDWEPTLF